MLIVGKLNAVQRMRYLPVVQKGEHLHLPFVKYQHTNAIVVKSAAAVPAHRDGEFFSADTFEIRCLVKRFSLLW
jgi:diacylglycerol kinase family enzyme